MGATVVLIVVGELGTVHKALEKPLEESEIRGRIETVQIKRLFISA